MVVIRLSLTILIVSHSIRDRQAVHGKSSVGMKREGGGGGGGGGGGWDDIRNVYM